MKETEIVRWLKRIFSLKTFEILLALGALIIGYYQFIYQKGGELSVVYDSTDVENNGSQTLMVCVDSRRADMSGLPLSPEFVNAGEHSIREFQLQYRIRTSGLELQPSVNYRMAMDNGYIALRYLDNIIYSYSSADSPVGTVELTADDAQCEVHARASYDGARHPFDYTVKSRFIVVGRQPGESFEQWMERSKLRLASTAESSIFNTVYIFGNQRRYESNVNIAALRASKQKPFQPSEAGQTTAEATAKPTPQPVPTPVRQPTAAAGGITVVGQQTVNDDNGNTGVELTFEPTADDTDAMLAFKFKRKSNGTTYHDVRWTQIDRNSTSKQFFTPNADMEFIEVCKEDPGLNDNIKTIDRNRYKNLSNTPIAMMITTPDAIYYNIVRPWKSHYFSSLPKDAEITGIRYFKAPDERSWFDRTSDANWFFWPFTCFSLLCVMWGGITVITDRKETTSSKIGWVLGVMAAIAICIFLVYIRYFAD